MYSLPTLVFLSHCKMCGFGHIYRRNASFFVQCLDLPQFTQSPYVKVIFLEIEGALRKKQRYCFFREAPCI